MFRGQKTLENLGQVNTSVELKSEKRLRRLKKVGAVLGVGAVIAASSVTGWKDGFGTGFANGAGVEFNELTAAGGQSEIVKVDLDFKQLCYTSLTIHNENASGRVANLKVGNWEALWREAVTSFDAELERCINPDTVEATKNQETGDINVNIVDADALTVKASIVPGTIRTDYNGAPANQLVNAFTDMTKSIAFVQDIGLIEDAAGAKTDGDSILQNISLAAGLKNDVDKCLQLSIETTNPAVEKGLKSTVLAGQLLDHPEMTEDDITVTIEGKDFNEMTKNTTPKSNIDGLFDSVKDLPNMQISAGVQGECSLSPVMETVPNISATSRKDG